MGSGLPQINDIKTLSWWGVKAELVWETVLVLTLSSLCLLSTTFKQGMWSSSSLLGSSSQQELGDTKVIIIIDLQTSNFLNVCY